METIKTKNGELRYREMIWINGRSVKSPVFKRKFDCNQWIAKQRNDRMQNKIHGDSKLHHRITLSEFCQNWLKTKLAQGVSKSTYQNYEAYIRNQIDPFFANKILQQITKRDIEEFQTSLSKKHNSKGLNGIIIVLKSIFKEAIKENYLVKSPCEYITYLKEDKNYDVFWTKSEVDQFLRANFKSEHYDLFLTALNTGMRKGELAGLCWDRVDFLSNTITVTRTRDRRELKERTKTNVVRVIPMNVIVKMTLLSLFKKRIEKSISSNFVFLNMEGNPVNPHHLYRLFSVAQKRAVLSRRIRFHDLRHTFASQYIINGGSIYDLQKFLGHTDIQMTTRYAHHSMDYLQKAMSGFSLGSSSGESELADIKSKAL